MRCWRDGGSCGAAGESGGVDVGDTGSKVRRADHGKENVFRLRAAALGAVDGGGAKRVSCRLRCDPFCSRG